MCCPALQRKQAQAHCKWGRTPDTRSHRPMVRTASLSCIRKHLPGWGPLAVWAPRRLGGHVHRPRLPWLALPRRHGGSASARGRPQARSRSAVDQQCHIQCTCLTHPRFCFNGGRTHRSSIRIGYTGHLIRCVRCGRGKRHQVGPWVVTAAAHTKSSVQPSQTRSATRSQLRFEQDVWSSNGAPGCVAPLCPRPLVPHLCIQHPGHRFSNQLHACRRDCTATSGCVWPRCAYMTTSCGSVQHAPAAALCGRGLCGSETVYNITRLRQLSSYGQSLTQAGPGGSGGVEQCVLDAHRLPCSVHRGNTC